MTKVMLRGATAVVGAIMAATMASAQQSADRNDKPMMARNAEAAHVMAAVDTGDQPMDPDYARDVAKWTTRPEFMSPLVDHLPLSSTIPSPKQVLGDHIGVPNKLHSYEQIVGYFEKLEQAAPDQVRILRIGKSNEGRENIIVMLSGKENMAKLDTYKKNLALLADPRQITPEQARQLISETKPIYHVLAGLHSVESGPPEMVMELAYRLLAENSPMIESIRNNVVVAISPVLEADGRDRYVDWYHRHQAGKVYRSVDEAVDPPYWGKYINHDNNRDINFSDPSARQLINYYLEWHPPIMHEMHEPGAFFYTYSGQAPQNPELDPILYGELPLFANFEMSQLTKYGMPGVWTHGFMDAWSPGYLGAMASNHNSMLRMYETFASVGANTMLHHLGAEGDYWGKDSVKRKWYRPLPPYKGGVMWSIRNNINYMESAMLSALQLTSKFPDVILENFYKKSFNAITKGEAKAPYAYIIPGNQNDPTRIQFVVNALRRQGIEVGRTPSATTVKDKTYPANSLIIKLNQPYGPLAKTLLRLQNNYPDENLKTYDDSGWTMGLMTHTDIVEVDDKSILDTPTTPVDTYAAQGSIGAPGAPSYAVLDHGSVGMATLRYRLKDVAFQVAEAAFEHDGTSVPAGSYLVPGSAYEKLKPEVERLGLTMVAAPARPPVATHAAPIPRVALYSEWGNTKRAGWVRYAFDQYDTPYDLIFKEQVRGGNLRSKYDIIILPDQAGLGWGSEHNPAKEIVFGLPMKGQPLPYTKTPKYPSLGEYGSSPDIRGGMGLPGLSNLRKFVESGGTLITLGNASSVPPSYNLVNDVAASHPDKDFYAPGPIVKAKVLQPKSPIFYGYTDTTMPVRWATNELLSVAASAKDRILMQFPGGKPGVMSGFMKGAKQIKDRPAIINMPVGQGRVLMFATNPVWRWQNLGEFRMLYNAMLNWKHLGGPTGVSPQEPDTGALLDKEPVFDTGTDPADDD